MNQKLLLRVRSAILAHPDQFEMAGYFGTELYVNDTIKPAGGCGTAGCIAGWASFLASKARTLAETDRVVRRPHDEAAVALELASADAFRLFFIQYWPRKFADRYNKAKSVRPRARAAADRISWFIKTKGAE